MCILRVRRVVQDDGYTFDASSSWVFCEYSNQREPCPNQERREQLIRVPNSSAMSSPGLVAPDTSSVTSSMPSTPTSGVRFDIREPLKNSVTGNQLRYGNFLQSPPQGRRASRNAAPRPVISQPDPPYSRGRINRVPLPTGIRDHRRVHSDSEYEERLSTTESSDRATEILDRNAARERARQEQIERNRRLDDIRRKEEEREERETALDEEERRTQQRMSWRENLRRQERQRLNDEENRRREREREERRKEEEEEERRRETDREKLEKLKREIDQDKQDERRRLEREEEEERYRRELDELLEEERRRRSKRAQLERELRYYQELEARLDHAERRRAEEEAYSRELQEAEESRRIRDIRRAENAKLQRQRQAELYDEQQRLQDLQGRLENVRRLRQTHQRLPPQAHGLPSYPVPPRSRGMPYLTQGTQAPDLAALLRQQPSSILDENVRRARGEQVLDRARQNSSIRESTEFRIPLTRRNTIGGGDRARETQYRTMRRYPG
jgi:hypothetical protein